MRLTAALLWLLLLAAAAPVRAQNPIHHCIGAHGNPVFTDQPCAALDATSVGAAQPTGGDSGLPDTPPPVLCAATTAQLRQSVIDAFAQRDANRMAGLMLWSGYGQDAAVADIRSLALLMRRPLLALQPSGSAPTAADPPPAGAASSGAAPAADAATASPQLRLQLAGTDPSGSPRELRFDIVRRAGCLWLRNAD